MSSAPLAYDVTRLTSRIFSRTPNGIDRVDMAYAEQALSRPEAVGLVYLGPLGHRALGRDDAREAIAGIATHFRETDGERDPDLLAAVSQWAQGAIGVEEVRAIATGTAAARRAPWSARARYTARTLSRLGRRAAHALPRDARYLCVSQFPLSERGAYRWLAARRDVKPVFFIHDLLPLQFPEYFLPHERARHARRISQLAQIGAAALVSSETVAADLRAALAPLGRASMPIHVAPMLLAPSFAAGPPAGQEAAPFFLQCGTIEPRKNHLTLLHCWRDMAARLGPDTPKLVIAGARGWENENVLDLLDRSPALSPHVLELSGLASPTLAALMKGARALLMPSFGEGYGLPVAEALALGTPVIASDIPVFHEVTGGHFTPVSPIDGPGWIRAIAAARKGRRGTPHVQRNQRSFEELWAFLARI